MYSGTLSLIQTFSIWRLGLLMTFQLKTFLEVCVILEYLNKVLYINVCASNIQTFQLSEHTQVPDKRD